MSAGTQPNTWGPRTLLSVRHFQAYVRECASNRVKSWPEAKTLIQKIANSIHEDYGGEPLPVSLGPVIKMFRVALSIDQFDSSGGTAKLVPTRGGFDVTVFHPISSEESAHDPLLDFEAVVEAAPTRVGNRTRFTVAHELGHTLFYHFTDSSKYPTRIIPQPAPFAPTRWREEGLCHDFARALLIPSHTRRLISAMPHIGLIVDLVRVLRVTPEPLVRRIMYDWELWPEAVLVQLTYSDRAFQAKLFRGVNRRSSAEGELTGPYLERELTGARSLSEAEQILTEKKLLSNRRSVRGSRTLWGVLAR